MKSVKYTRFRPLPTSSPRTALFGSIQSNNRVQRIMFKDDIFIKGIFPWSGHLSYLQTHLLVVYQFWPKFCCVHLLKTQQFAEMKKSVIFCLCVAVFHLTGKVFWMGSSARLFSLFILLVNNCESWNYRPTIF